MLTSHTCKVGSQNTGQVCRYVKVYELKKLEFLSEVVEGDLEANRLLKVLRQT